MMPQDFPSSGFEQAAGLAAVQAFDARTATALVRLERRSASCGNGGPVPRPDGTT